MRRVQPLLIAALVAGSLVVGSCGTGSDNEAIVVDTTAEDQPAADGGQPDALAATADDETQPAADNEASAADTAAEDEDRSEADGGQPDALAMAAEVGDIDLSEDEARLVAVEAAWLCHARRFSFGDPSEMAAARDDLLAGNGVTAEQYTAFSSELTNRLDLREAVLAEFATECLNGD